MEPKDVDAAVGRRGHEAPRELCADGARADEEAAAQSHGERSLRPCLECSDPLPGALDPTAYGAVEDTAAGDFEVGEAGAVESLRQPQQVGGRHPPRERLLREEPDRRVHQGRHCGGP